MTDNKLYYAADGLTGGTPGKLDSYPAAGWLDGHWAISKDAGKCYFHYYDSARTDAENPPLIIRPDDFSGSGVLVLMASPYGDLAPPGLEIMWPTETPPEGYLEENGAAISRTAYAALFAVIGTMYGVGDGSTTFNIPDKRGEFIRGWAHGSTNDPDRATRTDRGDGTTGDHVGTKQAISVAHTHTYVTDTGITYSTGSASSVVAPRNVNVMFCIKY